ncbi:MAG: hypothetical protein ACI9KE_002450 [Polyangiales bacterium]|jgi:hypothetical protein
MGSTNTLPSPEVLRDAVQKAMPRQVPKYQRSKVAEWTAQIKLLALSGLGPKEVRRRLRKTHDFKGSYSQVKPIVREVENLHLISASSGFIMLQRAQGCTGTTQAAAKSVSSCRKAGGGDGAREAMPRTARMTFASVATKTTHIALWHLGHVMMSMAKTRRSSHAHG